MITADPSSKPPTYSDDQRGHVIIAEDNAITRRLIELAVAQVGLTFDSTSDGREALSAAEQSADKLSLVLSDTQLADMTGVELAREIKNTPTLASVPVVLMGWPEEEPEVGSGFYDDFLNKPVCISRLLDILTS